MMKVRPVILKQESLSRPFKHLPVIGVRVPMSPFQSKIHFVSCCSCHFYTFLMLVSIISIFPFVSPQVYGSLHFKVCIA